MISLFSQDTINARLRSFGLVLSEEWLYLNDVSGEPIGSHFHRSWDCLILKDVTQ